MESTAVERSDNLIFREIDDEVIIISQDRRTMHMLNETASLIWRCVGRAKTLDEMVECMCQEYDVARDKAADDVSKALNEMRTKKLLRFCSTNGDS